MKTNLVFLITLSCLLGACALDQKRIEPPVTRLIVQPAPPSEVDQLLAYLLQARKFDTRDFATEREQSRSLFQTDKSDFNRVKLAVLLASMPLTANPNAVDDAELIALLEPVASRTNTVTEGNPTIAKETEVRALAMLMYAMAQDRKKLRDQWRDAQARLNAVRRDDSKEMEARALRTRVEELERKLAALKSIDRSVNRRSETQRAEPQRVESPK
jgi:hypothetical protein